MNSEIILKSFMGKNLTEYEAEELVIYLVGDEVTESTKAAVLSSLYIKGESLEEISGFSRGLRKFSPLTRIPGLTDIVGTGGDHKNTINVSTAASIVCSALGIKIGKHGNRSVTGLMGSADFLERIGYNFQKNNEGVVLEISKHSYTFILAPLHNSAFSKFSSVRKKLQFRTIFNLMGPITNPLDPDVIIIGVAGGIDPLTYAKVMQNQKKIGYVVSADDGTDEISISSNTKLLKVDGSIREHTINPKEILGRSYDIDEVIAPNKDEIYLKTLEGLSGSNEICSKFIALNAAPAILSNELSQNFNDAYDLALKAIKKGKALQKLRMIGNFKEANLSGA
jgi:anthranilate phosphoribosyltransferase